MSIFERALGIHLQTLQAVAGEPIFYRRGDKSYRITGMLARKRPDSEEGQGKSAITARVVDWLVRPFADSLSQPIQGDTITTESGRTFEVRAVIGNSPCWEWSDPRHTFYRIHTIEQKQE